MNRHLGERVTIGVPTRNRPSYLGTLLSSLLSQSFSNWDLILVNDGDENLEGFHFLEGIFNIIEYKGHGLKIIPGPQAGPAQAHNVILANSQNELIMRVDDDVYLNPDYIEILYEFMANRENVGAVGGRLLNIHHLKTGFSHPLGEHKEWNGRIVFKDSHFVPYADHFLLKEEPYEADHLYCHFLYQKRVAEEVGGFPDLYSQMGRREETDTTLRMRMAGYRLFVLPQATAWHIHSFFGGTRDGIDKSNYQKYLQMEEDDVRLFEARMWGWIREGLREKVKIVIPDEFEKLRQLRYQLKRLITRDLDFKMNLKIINLKKECLVPLNDQEVIYLLLSKVLTLRERRDCW